MGLLVLEEEDVAQFDAAESSEQVNEVYKNLFAKYLDDPYDYQMTYTLSEVARKAHERLVVAKDPHEDDEDADDPTVVKAWKIRRWAEENEIELSVKGRIPVAIENQYREAFGLEVKPEPVKVEKTPLFKKYSKSTTTTPAVPSETAVIRAWGIANGFTVGVKGRLRPELLDAYAKREQ